MVNCVALHGDMFLGIKIKFKHAVFEMLCHTFRHFQFQKLQKRTQIFFYLPFSQVSFPAASYILSADVPSQNFL